MSYTAIEEMRQLNLKTYGLDFGPRQPSFLYSEGNDMKSAALRFIHDRCEGLLFNEEITREEKLTGSFAGESLQQGQIPYNMEMDINRLCLERELERFIDSGNANDAYNVYYCYFEIYMGRYGKSKKMIELLSEFENNGSALLMKHRDHYSHSVYVFTLGLAIYETNEYYRRAFKQFYNFSTDENNVEEDRKAAHTFLAYWGMTALFHDIGYPFELPFEQVMSYFEVAGESRDNRIPRLTYTNMEPLLQFSPEETAHFRKLYGKSFSTLEELFAHIITEYLGDTYCFSEGHIYDVIHRKPVCPEDFAYHIDHGYFSAVRLYRELSDSQLGASIFRKPHMDVLAAILLHNSLFKKSIAFCGCGDPDLEKEPLRMEVFPLAYLLFLCDELQCWDRIAYGRNSRLEMHPNAVETDLSCNALRINYIFDSEEQEKIDEFWPVYHAWEQNGEQGKPPRLKEYSDMAAKEQRFAREIEEIVDTTHIPLTVSASLKTAERESKKVYLSSSNFLHLYDFAVALNARYIYGGNEKSVTKDKMEADFDGLSLEYQLSNINQAKNFAKYLNVIDCFYTDKPVDFDLLTAFKAEQIEKIAPFEHERWIREKETMGWKYGDFYRIVPADKIAFTCDVDEERAREMLREQLRIHELMIDGDPSFEEIHAHYDKLTQAEKEKDFQPFNTMLKLVKKFDGLRIYRLHK